MVRAQRAVNMSSATNVMEVISRGRFEVEDERGNSRRSGSSMSLPARPESQLSLECLPPEEPHYGGSFQVPPDEDEPGTDDSFSTSEQLKETTPTRQEATPTRQEATPTRQEATPTSDLYSRIQILSEQVRAELSHREHLETRPPEDQRPHADASESSPIDEGSDDGSGRVESHSEFHCQDTVPDDTSTDSNSAQQYGRTSDPKLHRALEKMRKLDTKLADLSKKEKEAKRQRRLLEQQSEGVGTSQALVLMEIDGETPVESPVFATQLDENSSIAGDYSNQQPSVDEGGGGEGCSGAGRPESPSQESDQEHGPRPQQNEQMGVNFIKRNIELAREAGTLVAMTEAEKKRLEDLLAGDSLPESPFQLAPGLPSTTTGFSYNEQDLERIRDIDSRLQALMPPEDWESVCSSSRNTTPALHTAAEQVGTAESSDENTHTLRHTWLGEVVHVLQRFQMTREERLRLAEIDERLLSINKDRWSEAETMPSLSQSDLDGLLEQCMGSGESTDASITSGNDALTAECHALVHVDSPEQ